jgi:hypothetical protein
MRIYAAMVSMVTAAALVWLAGRLEDPSAEPPPGVGPPLDGNVTPPARVGAS